MFNTDDRWQNITLTFQAYCLPFNLSIWSLKKSFHPQNIYIFFFICHQLTLENCILPCYCFLVKWKWLYLVNIPCKQYIDGWKSTLKIYTPCVYGVHISFRIQKTTEVKEDQMTSRDIGEFVVSVILRWKISWGECIERAMAPADHYYSFWGWIWHILQH